ncbi:MAG TPA: GNAT family N-acetyltransferase [Ktedonobacteraceae bacterium]|nr:GNAT family N-acetyltransferase [Ktedonobacteraceae bacterium]
MLTTRDAADQHYRRDLGDGLVLRWSTADDREHIAQLCGHVFRDSAAEPQNSNMENFVRRLMSDYHPWMGSGDFAIIEDTRKEGNPIIACTCLWRHEWTYEGIPFGVGRPEIVASDPTYRRRGLIRALFETIHARSAAEGHLVQGITGIPYFYRQFGYEYVLDLEGKRVTYLSIIPKAKEGEPEPYTLRTATIEDLPVIMEAYNSRSSTSPVWHNIPERLWRYEIEAWHGDSEVDKSSHIQMIVDASGAPKGFLMTSSKRRRHELGIWAFEVLPGVNLLAMMPSVLRALQAYGLQMPTSRPEAEPLREIGFSLYRSHPVYEALGKEFAPSHQPDYAWYIRVADLPAFLQHIAPALEQRLSNSILAGYTGELKIDFYRSGLRMVFEQGHLTTAENWELPTYDSNAGAGFPPLIFLQLLFGYRSLDELRQVFPDVWANHDTEILLNHLFPAKTSYVLGL